MENNNEAKAIRAEEPTLMNAYHELSENVERFEAIIELTDKVNRKFDRTDDRPQPEEVQQLKESDVAEPDLIGLFMRISKKLNQQTEIMGNNLSRTLSKID